MSVVVAAVSAWVSGVPCRWTALLVLAVPALSAAPALDKSTAERITFAEVNSSALGRALPIAVISPVRGAAQDSPVLFILHGRGRHHRSLIDSEARPAMLAAPFTIVLPQGEDGWYIDAPARPDARYATYLEEVIAWAEGNLSVTRSAARRGIAGWSMGGYGAVRFAQSHPGEFGFVGSIIGLLDFPRAETLPSGQNYRVPLDRFSADARIWEQLNPMNAVDRLRGSAVTLVLATRGFERTMNENFMSRLHQNNIMARVHWLEGGHEFPLVQQAIGIIIADAAEYFRTSQPE
jgi:S-formylglutathione hydrolase FrmB